MNQYHCVSVPLELCFWARNIQRKSFYEVRESLFTFKHFIAVYEIVTRIVTARSTCEYTELLSKKVLIHAVKSNLWMFNLQLQLIIFIITSSVGYVILLFKQTGNHR